MAPLPILIFIAVCAFLTAVASVVTATCWVLFYLRLKGVPIRALDYEIKAFRRRKQKQFLGM